MNTGVAQKISGVAETLPSAIGAGGEKMEKVIGHIGVDAGLCWLGDPCYILHKGKNQKDIGENWGDFCDKMMGKNFRSFNFDKGHGGLGVCFGTGFGDGYYPVYADITGGRIASVTVKFIERTV